MRRKPAASSLPEPDDRRNSGPSGQWRPRNAQMERRRRTQGLRHCRVGHCLSISFSVCCLLFASSCGIAFPFARFVAAASTNMHGLAEFLRSSLYCSDIASTLTGAEVAALLNRSTVKALVLRGLRIPDPDEGVLGDSTNAKFAHKVCCLAVICLLPLSVQQRWTASLLTSWCDAVFALAGHVRNHRKVWPRREGALNIFDPKYTQPPKELCVSLLRAS